MDKLDMDLQPIRRVLPRHQCDGQGPQLNKAVHLWIRGVREGNAGPERRHQLGQLRWDAVGAGGLPLRRLARRLPERLRGSEVHRKGAVHI